MILYVIAKSGHMLNIIALKIWNLNYETDMLSTQYRLRLEFICKKIANKEDVKLEDMIWAEKLAKAHTTARDWLNKARRQAAQDIQEGTMDDFMNKMGLGDPDPSNYRTGFDGADEIVDWFKQDKPDDWRQRD